METMREDAMTTPSELRRSVCAALRERALLGDRLAEGALKVLAHLEDQANRLAWQLSPKPEPARRIISNYDRHIDARMSPETPCPVKACSYCAAGNWDAYDDHCNKTCAPDCEYCKETEAGL